MQGPLLWVQRKRAGHGVQNGTPFIFSVGGKTVEVQAGECSARQTVPFGELTVTEQPVTALSAGVTAENELAVISVAMVLSER